SGACCLSRRPVARSSRAVEMEEADVEPPQPLDVPRGHGQILGLCNNFGYVVMLSAAHDILKQQVNDGGLTLTSCPLQAVLLADILPTLLIKLVAPFVVDAVPYGVRVLLCVLMAAVSFVLMSLSSAVWTSLLGVVFASVSAGLGELSFLSLTVFFSSYFFLLASPPGFRQWTSRQPEYEAVSSADRQRLLDEEEEESVHGKRSRFILGLTLCGLLKFVVPLGLVYFAEYFINQGLMELLFFQHFFLSHAEQYRWYQTLYQVGVLLSRSSLCCVKIRRLWLLALLQGLNAAFLFLAVLYRFLPSAWLMLGIVLYEGLLGGAAYVNTFYFISKETDGRHREFAMAAASVGDSLGIALAGLAAFPVHRYFCSL
uniref:Battenin n=1 Tax=Salarias fasciatus TaxID=181472 RepID=A0A672FEP2_SALFA